MNTLIECPNDQEVKQKMKAELLTLGLEVIYNVFILIIIRISHVKLMKTDTLWKIVLMKP